MDTKELTGWLGQWEVIIKSRSGNIIERTGIQPNLIMDVGLNMLRDTLNGVVTDGEIKYVAIGSGSTAPANGQSQLVSEQFRKSVTNQANTVNIGELETLVYITELEADSFLTQEIGWFAGAAASSAVNAGIMVARVLYNRQKNNLETWTIVRLDTIGRG